MSQTAIPDDAPCERCGDAHPLARCPYVKAIEYDETGNIRRVEFLVPRDYARTAGLTEPETGDDYPKLPGGTDEQKK